MGLLFFKSKAGSASALRRGREIFQQKNTRDRFPRITNSDFQFNFQNSLIFQYILDVSLKLFDNKYSYAIITADRLEAADVAVLRRSDGIQVAGIEVSLRSQSMSATAPHSGQGEAEPITTNHTLTFERSVQTSGLVRNADQPFYILE